MGTLAIPLLVYGLYRLVSENIYGKVIKIFVVAITVFILMGCIIIPVSSSDLVLAGDYLKTHVVKNDKVLIERDKYHLYPVVLLADLSYSEIVFFDMENRDLFLDCVDNTRKIYIVLPNYYVYSDNAIHILEESFYEYRVVLKTDTLIVYQSENI